jgi:hypothetical protein
LLVAHEGSTRDVAKLLAEKAGRRQLETLIHQALDQEIIHPDAVLGVVKRLQGVGIKPIVLRPDDTILLRGGKDVTGSWLRYGDPEAVKSMHTQLPASEKTLLITVGHGDNEGATSFSGAAKSGLQVVGELKLDVKSKAFMYIPLQCFPQLAVKRWLTDTGKASASMTGEEKQYDDEMQRWISADLEPVLGEWLTKL